MEKPLLKIRGLSAEKLLHYTWPFGYLAIYPDRLDLAMRVLPKNKIIAIWLGPVRFGVGLSFLYEDEKNQSRRQMFFSAGITGGKNKMVLGALAAAGYPALPEAPPEALT